jgi:hypothetical protein
MHGSGERTPRVKLHSSFDTRMMHVHFVSSFLSCLPPPLFFASISSNSLCVRVARTGVRPEHGLGGTPARTLDVWCEMPPRSGSGMMIFCWMKRGTRGTRMRYGVEEADAGRSLAVAGFLVAPHASKRADV